ncbi:MAG: preprotein translocase subunit SecY [Bacillales bacterium]|mgnify:FL=1|nr:preprotein translocase subunit SecY [Mollicutes bacterium]MCI7213850.1 preprotein translocase subunit SecY [Bacillales bacterium]MDD7715749.1 preprotein translocase subunit SecY [Mollicutes bacterium]MDY3904166.1 preprotein translocase subunit SecY [Candidatus Enteromonas sp.]MDY4935473.1 preprotein translocase subunit SecY [Candidatus Enteromonas sp.]
MKKFVSIFKNKEIVGRIFFTIMVLFVVRIGAAITVPGVSTSEELSNALNSGNAIAMMNILGGGALSNFSVFALGVSPYITAQIIIQLLSKDVLPALTELSKQGQYGRKKIEMATRYLTLLLGAVQAYGIIKTMQNNSYISLTLEDNFWTYAYIITVLLAGSMLTMWLGDQITEKGLGNGISIIIFAGCVRSLPIQISTAWTKWVASNMDHGSQALITGAFQFALYILAFILIVAGVVFFETAKRKIPVQHAGKGGQTASMARASFLPIKVNSAGVIPVIFASSIMMAPSVIASFISSDAANASWLKIFSYSEMYQMPGIDGSTWGMPWGLLIYIALIIAFTFFYSEMQIDPEQMADNFQKNGSYIPGIRPGKETERYVGKVLNRVTCIGALALAVISALPMVLVLSGLFGDDTSLAIGGTSLIIVVGVCIELNAQIDGLLAGKSFEEVSGGM